MSGNMDDGDGEVLNGRRPAGDSRLLRDLARLIRDDAAAIRAGAGPSPADSRSEEAPAPPAPDQTAIMVRSPTPVRIEAGESAMPRTHAR